MIRGLIKAMVIGWIAKKFLGRDQDRRTVRR